MRVEMVPIASIEIRERSRRSSGDITSLARSIDDRGLLHPIVVRRDGASLVLVAGSRRLAALRHLNRAEVPAHIAISITDELKALYAESEENTEREPFVATEMDVHAARIEAAISAQGKARQRDAGQNFGRGIASENLPEAMADTDSPVQPPEPPRRERETRRKIAKAVGTSEATLAKVRHVAKTARDPQAPAAVRETAKQAVASMDRTGKVDPAFRRVKDAEHEAAKQEMAALVERAAESGVAPPDAARKFFDAEQRVRREQFRGRFLEAIAAGRKVMQFDATIVAAACSEDEVESLRQLARSIAKYLAEIESHLEQPAQPGGLRVVNGGRA